MSERIFSLASLTVLELSPPQMVEVAARAGYSHVGLRLEPATPEEHHFAVIAGFEKILAVGAEFGASELLVAGNDSDEQRLTENFARLCDLAAPYGLHPHLEFMPWTDARNLQQAVRIVENARRENGAVLVDAFHFDRSASRLEDLARVAPSRLRYAQLCDVAGPRPTDMAEILRQARNERRFPGDGECDLAGLLRCLPSDIALSLEIPTVQLLEQGMSGLQRAQMALDKTRELLARLARDVFDFKP
jgi:sugar phosphate isomerase/epimerase